MNRRMRLVIAMRRMMFREGVGKEERMKARQEVKYKQ